jgi:hypothetical protein
MRKIPRMNLVIPSSAVMRWKFYPKMTGVPMTIPVTRMIRRTA